MFRISSIAAFAAALPLLAQTDREAELLRRIETLEQRLAVLEKVEQHLALPETQAVPLTATSQAPVQKALSEKPAPEGLLSGTTVNLYLDGYYGYNFNSPIGRSNLLRSNDVLSNSFSVNQAGIILERLPTASPGGRLGYRVDLMFGQNTETLQGGAQNELRPQVYRNLFQAYGTVVVPVGKGLTVDFGKFSSSLGYEGNYTKDQMNYSRSYFFNYLPFYHLGARAAYTFNDKVSAQYWLVNGANQSEDFNGAKSNAFVLALKPTKKLSWTSSYFFGEEGRDSIPVYNPGLPLQPTQPGIPVQAVVPRPDGRQHIFDSFAAWNATDKLTLAAEADYVVNREFRKSAPAHVTGASLYAGYRVNRNWSFGSRFEYLSDRGGLFTGATQAIREATVTATYQVNEGMQLRGEYRGDFRNRRFFLTDRENVTKSRQDTATLALIWWLGGKQGSW